MYKYYYDHTIINNYTTFYIYVEFIPHLSKLVVSIKKFIFLVLYISKLLEKSMSYSEAGG